MKNILQPFSSIGINNKSKVEPAILWNLKDYPLSYMPLIIQIEQHTSNSFEKKLRKMGCKNITYLKIIHSFYLLSPISKIKEIIGLPAIGYISLNHKVFSHMNYATEKLGSSKINQFGPTGRNITIAHLDTGIYPHHDLITPRKRIIAFHDFMKESSKPYDDNGHGTHCAGSIAGNGALSKGQYKGIAPDASLIGLKCLDEKGTGDIKTCLQALDWIYDNHRKYNIKIAHLPFGVNYPYPIDNDPLIKAVEKLWDRGIVIICSAGNNGPTKASIASPGSSEKVITVGSSIKNITSDTSSAVSSFSSRGPTLSGHPKPDLVAPGTDITSLYCDTGFDPLSRGIGKNVLEPPYISFTGTSVSSAIVAGAVALLLEKHPEFTPDEVKLALEMSCDSLYLDKNTQGKGLLNIEKLLTGKYD